MSITGLGQSYKNQAISGLRDVSKMEAQRETANTQIAEQKKQSQISNTAMGGAMGAMAAGAQAGGVTGPWGAVIGAAAGFLFSSLF